MAPRPSTAPAQGDDLEARLHQSKPRMLVKGMGLKRRLRLMKVSNKIGRAETVDVLLPHESVSEQHAEIHFDGHQWMLRDSGSTNGSIVDGQHLRGTEQVIGRNSLIAIGSLNIIFQCVEAGRTARNRRDEERALHHLVRRDRISKEVAAQINQVTRDDPTQSIAEVLLMETALNPIDWANAIAIARTKVGLLERLLRLFSFSRR